MALSEESETSEQSMSCVENEDFDQVVDEVTEQCPENTPMLTIEAIAQQILLAREARRRIDEEGIVVRDMRGAVLPHPAITIEADAVKLFTMLLQKATT
jgi:hypothetical protein